jgi:hypothetical protein
VIKSYDWLKANNLKPSTEAARDKSTFKRTRGSFEERKIQSKVCFWATISKKKYFFIKRLQYFNDSNLVIWAVLSILHPLTATTSCVTVSHSKYYTSLNMPKNLRTLTSEKRTLKLLYVLETCFVLNVKYCWKFLAFFLRIFHSIPAWRPSIWLQDGGQVIVSVLLEFTGVTSQPG